MKINKLRANLAAACCGTAFAFMMGSLGSAFAADGSGTNVVAPTAVQAGSTGDDFTFTYTATEDMADGAVLLTVPDPWADPTSANTTVEVINGQTGAVIDTLDASPPTGWQADFVGPLQNLGLCGLLGVVCDADLSTDTADPHTGTGDLHVEYGLANISALGQTRVFFNFGSAQDWSSYNYVSFWIRTDGLALANLLAGGTFRISESASLPGNATTTSYDMDQAILDVPLLQGGDWSQVIIDLQSAPASSRNAVRSFGFVSDNLVGLQVNGGIFFDQIMAGPAGPIYSGNTVTQTLISLDNGGNVIFHYNDVTAPNTPNTTYTFTTQSEVDSSGDLANIGTSPTITVTATAETGCTGGNCCGNGTDDDVDTLTDCLDPDCSEDPACADVEVDCNNGFDDATDEDSLSDCADHPDCDLAPNCNPETQCADGLDNDLDEAVDCNDSDCVEDPVCNPEICNDNADNDGDEATDCADSDCASDAHCNPEPICNDDVDNDTDGATDCADSDCAAAPNCNPEDDCDDGADNDFDGSIDCSDSDCSDAPNCNPEPVCNDGIDNDTDGRTDCDDSDCAENSACANPGGDDDGDGVDNDSDNCPDVSNPDQTDTDGDGIGDACDDDANLAGGDDDGGGATPPTGTPGPLDVQGGGCSLIR